VERAWFTGAALQMRYAGAERRVRIESVVMDRSETRQLKLDRVERAVVLAST
jgi:hypothetical protein